LTCGGVAVCLSAVTSLHHGEVGDSQQIAAAQASGLRSEFTWTNAADTPSRSSLPQEGSQAADAAVPRSGEEAGSSASGIRLLPPLPVFDATQAAAVTPQRSLTRLPAVQVTSAPAPAVAIATYETLDEFPAWPELSTNPVDPEYRSSADSRGVILPAEPVAALPADWSAIGELYAVESGAAELPSVQTSVQSDPAAQSMPAMLLSGGSGAAVETTVSSVAQSPAASAGITLEQVREEAKKFAWTKGDFKIVPYGSLWFNSVYETQRTLDGDYTLFVYSPSVRDYDAFHVNARATRLGIDVSGPNIPLLYDAPSGGKVEIDFFGAFPTSENRASVLLRHAYWEVKNEEFRLLAGQTWDLMSPLLPGTLMYTVGWDAGNLGYRRPQLRLERYFPVSDSLLLTLSGALACNIACELPGLAGDHEGWPVIQTRAAVTLGPRGKDCRPVTLGFSGHVGEQFYERNANIDSDDEKEQTWSFNVDLHMPITPYFGLQGEGFIGSNLGPYLAGIGQGVNPITGQAIRACGGWLELWYDWSDRLHSRVGYGIDDPINRDVFSGGRSYNNFIYTNVSYDLTKKFVVGVEYSHWKTHYIDLEPGESDRIEFMAKYNF